MIPFFRPSGPPMLETSVRIDCTVCGGRAAKRLRRERTHQRVGALSATLLGSAAAKHLTDCRGAREDRVGDRRGHCLQTLDIHDAVVELRVGDRRLLGNLPEAPLDGGIAS